MKNLVNFFFSFDKLFKEKLIVPAFWLAIVYYGLKYLVQAVDAVQLHPLNWFIGPVSFIAKILFTLLVIRIVAELVVAIFRINDNLSPDKGKSELADIDPMLEARKAAEMAAARTREATKSVSEKASAATKSVRENVDDMADTVQAKAKSVTQSSKEKTESIMGKGSVPHPDQDPTPVKILEPSAADTPKKRGRPKGSTNKPKPASSATPKKRGRPAGSKNKTKTTTTTKAKTAPKKRGPKPGSKAPRDADGNLLKKDGTPRKKPGPKPKS
ncbi:DUF4282 domain-containing protein [Litorimonas sp. WD9-15]|uniref:DUF4282 domain-containing protein n=1 Tax=Litorimonas sp. WD9-15 TaxID=3418716 RepID=UPI003D03265D